MAEADDKLTKVDSVIDPEPASPSADKKGHRRASSSANGVFNIADLGMIELTSLVLAALTGYRKGRKGAQDSEGDTEAELVSASSLSTQGTEHHPLSTLLKVSCLLTYEA